MLRLKATSGTRSRTDLCSPTWRFLLASQCSQITGRKVSTSCPSQCQNNMYVEIAFLTESPENHRGSANTAFTSKRWESATEIQQFPSRCMNQHKSQLTLLQLLPRARVAQLRRSRQDSELVRSRSTQRNITFYHILAFLMRLTICGYKHEPKLLLKPPNQYVK